MHAVARLLHDGAEHVHAGRNCALAGRSSERLRQLAQMSPGAIQQYALKPASLARLVTSSDKVLSRIAFLAERHPEENISAVVAVNTSSKTFVERFPDFDEWSRDR